MSLLGTPVQKYLAGAYLQNRGRWPEKEEYYWKNSAVADTGLIAYFGPLTSWMPYVVITRAFGENGAALVALAVIAAGALAIFLAFLSSRSPRWKSLTQLSESQKGHSYTITIVKLGAWIAWGFLNPWIWWKLLAD